MLLDKHNFIDKSLYAIVYGPQLKKTIDYGPYIDKKKYRLFNYIKSDPRQTCLSIITLYSGMEQAFFIDSFTSSFINCGFGPEWIGYIMIFYGVGNSLFSFIWGYLDGKLGRIFVFISGFILNLGEISN